MIKLINSMIKHFLLLCISFSWMPLWAQNSGAIQKADSVLVKFLNGKVKETTSLIELNPLKSTAAISTVSGNELYTTPAANLTNTLYGLLPGLTVFQASGEPGYDAASLWIRGIGSFNYGDYAIYVDGFQTTSDYIQYLSPSEIESFSVLKDAAALAPLGMKAANGAIWITTKRGTLGKARVTIKSRYGFQSPQNINKPLDSYQYALLYNEAVSNDNGRIWSPVYSESQLQAYNNGTGINTDWYDEVLKKYGHYTSSEAIFEGGLNDTRYFVLMGYVRNTGLYDVTNDDTHSNATRNQLYLRTNFDFTLFQIFEGRVEVGGRTAEQRFPNYSGYNLWNNLARYPSNIYNPKNDDGTWAGINTFPDNPLASITETGYNSNHDFSLMTNFTLKEKLDFITNGLYFQQGVSFSSSTRGSYNVTKNYARFYNGIQQTTDQNTNYSIYDDYGTKQWNWRQYNLQLGYVRQFGRHSFNAIANYLQYIYRTDASQNGSAGLNMDYAYQNLGGRIHYGYNDRYFADFGFAYSGSDNFAKGNRFVFYPTLSAAWLISKESFLENSQIINLLKLRASAGKSGYDDSSKGRYLYQLYYTYPRSFPTGTGTPTWHGGISPAYTPNPDITAESSIKYNLGIDIELLSNLAASFDAFLDKRSNILVSDNSLMSVFGATPPYRNIGKVTNKGFELSLAYNGYAGDFVYQLIGTIANNSNKIDYMAEIPPVTPSSARTGRSITSRFGYQFDGFYDISDFDTDGNLVSGIPIPGFGEVQPGDLKYKDMNNDTKIDEQDIVKVGKGYIPSWDYSFVANAKYKKFDFRVLFQGSGGRDVNLLDADIQTVAFRNNGNVYKMAQDRWAYYPEEGIDTRAEAKYPRLSTLDNFNNYKTSTFWIKNGGFLRLRNVEIGYTFPNMKMKKARISDLRIYANGINLFTWSPLSKDYNIDPVSMTGYAALKSFNFGLSVNF